MNGRFRYIGLLVVVGVLGGAALIFAQQQFVESPIVKVTTPAQPSASTISFVVKVGNRVISSAENGSCLSNLEYAGGPAGLTSDIGSCVRPPIVNPSAGTYWLSHKSGFPVGADPSVKPTISPSSDSLTSQNSITFTMTFASAPVIISCPYVDLKVNGSDGPVSAGSAPVSVTVSWKTCSPSEFSSCSASGGPGGPGIWVGAKDVNGSSEVVSILSNGNYAFAISCVKQTGYGGYISDVVMVNVGTSVINIPSSAHLECRNNACVSMPGAGSNQCSSNADCVPPPPPPTVDLKVSNSDGPVKVLPNDTVVLTWSSADASSCRASSNPTGVWSGSKSTQSPAGGERSVPITANTVFTLTCYGPGGASSDSTTVNLGYGTRGFEEF